MKNEDEHRGGVRDGAGRPVVGGEVREAILHIRIAPTLKRRAEVVARAKKQKLSALVVEALEEKLEKEAKE